jgi:hypothetical protein
MARPDERTTGRKSNPAVAEFGEAVWWMPLQTTATQLPPLGARFEEGFYVGLADGSAESLILTPTGLVKCRSVRRRPLSERWSQAILETTASELQPNSLRPGEARIGIRAPVHIEPVPSEPPAFRDDPKPRAPRQTQLLRSDFAGPGLTPGCPGCDVIRRKSNEAARHSDACRQRMEPILQQSDEGRSRIRRAHERVAQYMDDLAQEPAKRRGGVVESSLPVPSEGVVAPTHPAAGFANSAQSAPEGLVLLQHLATQPIQVQLLMEDLG